MKKERNIKRKQRMIRFSLLNRKSKTGWAIGVQLMFRRTGSLNKVLRKITVKPAESGTDEPKFIAKPVLSRMTIRQKIDMGYRVYLHIKNNPDFAMITPQPDLLLIAVQALDEASCYFILKGSALNREIMWDKEEVFDEVFRAVLSFVDWVAKGSEDVYRSAGIFDQKL